MKPDGETEDVSAPQVTRPAELSEELPEGDPRVLHLTDADVGCLFKLKVHPVRADGDQGHVVASRPTRPVQAAPPTLAPPPAPVAHPPAAAAAAT